MTRFLPIAAFALCACLAHADAVVRWPDVAAFEASETLVAIARNAPTGGETPIDVYDATTGAHVARAMLPGRVKAIFFCSHRAMIVSAERAVHRIDPRTGAAEEMQALAEGEEVAVSPRCDSLAIFGVARRDVAIVPLAGGRRFAFEAPLGTLAACFSGDDGVLFMLAASGAVIEGDLRKKRHAQRAAPEAPLGIACTGKRTLVPGNAACPIAFHACAISADGRTTVSAVGEDGNRSKALRFRSTSRLKGVAQVPLDDIPVSVASSPSGADAVVTLASGDAIIVSRANGATIRLPKPAP